jgi:hypothetical protein
VGPGGLIYICQCLLWTNVLEKCLAFHFRVWTSATCSLSTFSLSIPNQKHQDNQPSHSRRMWKPQRLQRALKLCSLRNLSSRQSCDKFLGRLLKVTHPPASIKFKTRSGANCRSNLWRSYFRASMQLVCFAEAGSSRRFFILCMSDGAAKRVWALALAPLPLGLTSEIRSTLITDHICLAGCITCGGGAWDGRSALFNLFFLPTHSESGGCVLSIF